MSDPIRCLSSHVTTHLLQNFRNEQGSEENWIQGSTRINHFAIYCGKVFTAEIAVAILCVTSGVEAIAYAILIIPALPLSCYDSRLLKKVWGLLDSSFFTCKWNFANALIFNLAYVNLYSHESLARISIDYSDRGKLFKFAAITALFITVLITSPSEDDSEDNSDEPLGAQALILLATVSVKSVRASDRLYLLRWFNRHFPNNNQLQFENLFIDRLQPLLYTAKKSQEEIDQGVKFFKEYILGPECIDERSKGAVMQCEAKAFHFVLTRAIYLYCFDPTLIKEQPSFFCDITLSEIGMLRDKLYSEEILNNLKKYVFSYKLFKNDFDKMTFNEKDATDENKQLILASETLFNELRCIAHKEMQGVFVKECWSQAIKRENE